MLPLFIVENIPDRGDLVIEGDEAHHAGSVSRIKVGEKINVTNGVGRIAEVEVLDINKRNIGCRILEVLPRLVLITNTDGQRESHVPTGRTVVYNG